MQESAERMIFQHYIDVIDGTKTQTRRVVKDGETLHPAAITGLRSIDDQKPWIWTAKRWLKWQVGRTYAIQAGRSGPTLGRFRLTGIRRESLWEITAEDAEAEGYSSRVAFRQDWDRINITKGHQWEDNPMVWCLTIEPAITRDAAPSLTNI
jgi:hypothetical protein